MAIRIDKKNPYLKAYSDLKENVLVIITGHEDGRAHLWENCVYEPSMTKKFSNSLVSIISY